MDKRNNAFKFDFTPIGQAIKKARKTQGMTREQLAHIIDYDPRHLQTVENEGQYPSIELFIQLIMMIDISLMNMNNLKNKLIHAVRISTLLYELVFQLHKAM